MAGAIGEWEGHWTTGMGEPELGPSLCEICLINGYGYV